MLFSNTDICNKSLLGNLSEGSVKLFFWSYERWDFVFLRKNLFSAVFLSVDQLLINYFQISANV